MNPDLEFALAMATAADQMTMSHYRALDLVIETKPDRTPVTQADKGTERLLRDLIARERPDDGIVGEEFQAINPDAPRQWVLDPIDGTRNYVRGVPVWATLIALLVDGTPTVGVVSAPALRRKWWAAVGEGAFTQDVDDSVRGIQVSKIAHMKDASFSFSDPVGWEAYGRGDGLAAIQSRVDRIRAYGDFWSHMMVAEGVVDIAAEPELSPWDQAALVPVIIEAGGMVTGLDGNPLFESGSSLTTNSLLHAQVLEVIAQN